MGKIVPDVITYQPLKRSADEQPIIITTEKGEQFEKDERYTFLGSEIEKRYKDFERGGEGSSFCHPLEKQYIFSPLQKGAWISMRTNDLNDEITVEKVNTLEKKF